MIKKSKLKRVVSKIALTIGLVALLPVFATYWIANGGPFMEDLKILIDNIKQE